jgi:vancomycin permeability regulator SanA
MLGGMIAFFKRWLRAHPVNRWLRLRPLLIVAMVAAAVAGVAVTGSVLWVRNVADAHLYSVASVPTPGRAVLGSQVYADQTPSPVLADRLETALRLFRDGRIRAILVSGDNGEEEYNEVDPMRQWLITRGVPASRVIGDYAGFDTYSSCVRAVKIFGVRDAMVVTQQFHLPRAVALCRKVGMDAIGVRAGTTGLDDLTLRRLAVRDDLACVKAAFQMVTRPDPRYLGRHESGVEAALAEP